MVAITEGAIASAVITCLAWAFDRFRCKCEREFGIVMISGSGKTTLINQISDKKKKNHKTVFVDLDALVFHKLTNEDRLRIQMLSMNNDFHSIQNLLLPLYIQKKKEMKKMYKKKHIFWFSTNVTILHLIDICDIQCYLPCNSMYADIQSRTPEEERANLELQRHDAMRSGYTIHTFQSYDDLGQLFVKNHGLQFKI